MKTLYTAHATSVKGREGHVETDDKKISLDLSAPGGGKEGTNPEQLFACGYAACFGSAVQAVAKMQKIEARNITVKAEVHLNQDDNHGYSLSAALHVTIDGVDDQTAQKIVQDAHQMCPYSKATRGNIEVKLEAKGQAGAKAA